MKLNAKENLTFILGGVSFGEILAENIIQEKIIYTNLNLPPPPPRNLSSLIINYSKNENSNRIKSIKNMYIPENHIH